MKVINQSFVFSVALILMFASCKKQDDEPMKSDGLEVATCSDGIRNQNETGVDCGGVCTPCAPDSTASYDNGFKIDGVVQDIVDFDVNRNASINPSVIGFVIITREGALRINISEPSLGWSGGLSIGLNPPDNMQYEISTATNFAFYTSNNGNGSADIAFLKLDYRDGGEVKGSFSGTLEDSNGNTITITDGKFDTVFVN